MNLSPIVVSLWLYTLFHSTASRTLCPRIFFKNIDENKMPYKMIEGVFVKQSYNHNDFPVYKREDGDMLFYYYTDFRGVPALVFGKQLDDYFGVGVRIALNGMFPLTWLNTGTLNKKDVLEGLVSSWYYYDYQNKTSYFVTTPPTIKAVCVEDDFRECNSDRVYMNVDFDDGKGNILNDATTDYFTRSYLVFRNLRPVYRHTRSLWYLQYTSDKYWIVTSSDYPTNSTDNAHMKVKDLALRPEYITNTWTVNYDGFFYHAFLKVRCRGISSKTDMCPTKPCRNGAVCVYTSGNETLCICPTGYTGTRCTIRKRQCLWPRKIFGKELSPVHVAGKRPGDLAMFYCRYYPPSVVFAICDEESLFGTWSRQSNACTGRIFTTVTPRRSKAINFDDIPGVTPAVLTVAISVQILLPFVLWCCAFCRKRCKESDEKREDGRRLEVLQTELEARQGAATRTESQDQLEQAIQNNRETVEQYQQETEAIALNRRKGVDRNASLRRLISMDMYFSFFLWLFYLVGCEASECTQYGSVLGHLQIVAIVMMVLAPIIVLIESIFSHELQYIKNIMEDETAWSYIQRMQAVKPVIFMTAECYHFDSDGNRSKKVVSFVDCVTFSYGSWVDVSKREMPALSTVGLTRLKIDASFLFGDQETEEDFNFQRSDILLRNRHKDVFMDFSVDEDILGLKKRIAAYVDLNLKSWWICKRCFWLATLLFMSWPYRWLFRAKTAKNYYTLKKKMYKSPFPPDPRDVDLMDAITILQQQHEPATSIPLELETSSYPANTRPPFVMSDMANPQPISLYGNRSIPSSMGPGSSITTTNGTTTSL